MTHTFQRGDKIFVNGNDGNLWYAVIKDIRVQCLKKIQKAWIEVQWYYSRSDIGDKKMRKYIGNNELVLLDHNDIIELQAIVSWKLMESIVLADITPFSAERCFGPLIGPKDMYTWWTVSTHGKQVIQTKLNNGIVEPAKIGFTAVVYRNLQKKAPDPWTSQRKSLMGQVSHCRIFRGNEGGVVGNGEVMMSMWEEVRAAQIRQRWDVETGLQNHMTSDLLQQAQKSYKDMMKQEMSKELEEARVMIRRLKTALVVSDAVVELNREQWWDHAPICDISKTFQTVGTITPGPSTWIMT
ncbi:hypothetical protein F5J12DRAFT_779560 [Pisolithus orientalis]|uniref:uncharacterized protein n=1 Tax=Pisolithus orientalis TaxID=936130 RepID=UPI002224B08D|nr:uncharacterized protein F5J12DRAFT_779560 [Pisolithus orientalis]KAI6030398.1 hypothetical protein F5J12DRAFT_779560 [Pisolithus orientalis]